MNEDLGQGPRLTDEEYQKKIIETITKLPPAPTRKQQRQLRRQELELAIDHRLGRDFPHAKREALWIIQQRVEKKRLRLIFKYLLRKVFARSLEREAQGLAGYLVDEYALVLNQAELESFFGVAEVRSPTLPINMDQLKK
jgi:hypothetical protein